MKMIKRKEWLPIMDMNEFQNKLIIKDEPYQCGLFPQIPNFRKDGSAFILTGGYNDDLYITEYTTTREIRQGKYSRLVEISTRPYLKEIQFTANAQEQAYTFDVYVKAVIQVVDPITFYRNRNIDVDAYFYKLFSIDVKQITRQYSILNYDGLDKELTQKLSAYNTIDSDTGFSYQVSVVDAEPGKEAKEYVSRASKQQLEASLRNQAGELARSLTFDYAEAVMMEVAEGKISPEEAILKIEQHKDNRFEKTVENAVHLMDKGLLSEGQAKRLVSPGLEGAGHGIPSRTGAGEDAQTDGGLTQFYEEE